MMQVVLPMVRSWTGWNLLSVNCSNRHDFPTPEKKSTQTELKGIHSYADNKIHYKSEPLLFVGWQNTKLQLLHF